MKFKIYQIKKHHCKYLFRDYAYAKSHNFAIGDYEKVYEGELNAIVPNDTALELIFMRFNTNHPLDYNARSLSVSDIVDLEGKYFYCDDASWTELPIPTVLNGGFTS